tara:strand:+ start:585 stop:1091 length:507 start_codon:yes stop_codon:yes gene_type:complete
MKISMMPLLGLLFIGSTLAGVEPFRVVPETAESRRQAEAEEAAARKKKEDFRRRFDQEQAMSALRAVLAEHPSLDGVALSKARLADDWNWETDCGDCLLRTGDWYVDWARYLAEGTIQFQLRYRSEDKKIDFVGDREVVVTFTVLEKDGKLLSTFSSIATVELEEVII